MIFVAGMPRCGSTWAAKALAALTRSRYVHEPFNSQKRPEWEKLNMRYLRPDACDPELTRELKRAALAPDRLTRVVDRLRGGKNVVVKEVHCVLAIECVHRDFAPAVVIMSRHPCGVAASWKELGWMVAWDAHDPLLAQEDLVTDHLAPFVDHMRSSADPYFRLGAYWGGIYYVLHRLASPHPEWQWVTHEDLCAAPRERFRELLRALDRRLDESALRFFEVHDRALGPAESLFAIYRETQAEPLKWRETLTAEERTAVLRGAAPFGMDALLRSRVGGAPTAWSRTVVDIGDASSR